MQVFIGIDWSEDHHNVCIMNQAGAKVSLFEIPHSVDGFAQLETAVQGLGLAPSDTPSAIETHHNLLVDFLWAREYLLYVIPPSVINSCRGRFGSSRARTDQSDSVLLADILRTERQRLTHWQPDSDLVRQMRAKLRLIDQLTNSITRYANRLRAVLLRCYPQPVGLFSDLTTQIGLEFLMAYPTAQAAQALTYAEFAAFCAAQGYTHPQRQPELYAQLQAPMPTPDPAIVAAYEDQVTFLAHLLLTLVQRKRHTLRQIQDLFQAHPDYPVFDSLPGAGDLLAPSLLVKFGDHRGRFLTAADVQALAGTCPVTIWSGKKRYVKFRRACDREFRNIAQQFAISSVRQGVGWAIEYWGDARARGHSKAQAYRGLANRWLAVIWKMWQTREPYDEAYHTRQRALRRQPRS